MGSISTFLAMGGYARFVWPAYGLTLLVLTANVLLALWRERTLRRRLRRRIEREQV